MDFLFAIGKKRQHDIPHNGGAKERGKRARRQKALLGIIARRAFGKIVFNKGDIRDTQPLIGKIATKKPC